MSDLDDMFDAFDDEPQTSTSSNSKRKHDGKHDPSSASIESSIESKIDTSDTGKAKRSSILKGASSLLDSESSTKPPLHPNTSQSTETTALASAPAATASKINSKVSTGTADDKSINSFTALPPNYNKNDAPLAPPSPSSPSHEPAKTYPFTLDPFQKEAISYIDRNESVLVAAHTSAGKTAVAEYAVAKALKQKSRVIYTSPIKEEFTDVGLMTGDITINPTATALVMTTEILRSMLYRGSEMMREVAWVIYDEVHYMRDKERGVVWEESIILLPHKVRFVFLSATIPNSRQFVGWIAKIHNQPCHVVYTNYRPVPLQHYIFPAGGEGLHLVVDEKGTFREDNFQRAMASLQNVETQIATNMLTSGEKGSKKKNKGGKKDQKSDLYRIVKLVMERGLNPVIVFSFSKKECEKYALDLNKEDYNDETEKDLVNQVYVNAIDSLSDDDKKLPQVEALLPLLKRGIGIHHGGLLPILKEIVEILFSEGLIKCLFATETFSIGINMPAKTVIFTNCRKWDGTSNRWVTSGEYIQMSGRAGRRGKDDRGIVIQMMDEKMEPAVCKGILYGDPDPLNSSYHISYNMLLNMMRVEDVDPEFLIRASFHQYQQESEAPALDAQAEEYENKANEVYVEDSDEVGEYFGMKQQLKQIQNKIKSIVREPDNVIPFLQPGRLVKLVEKFEDSSGALYWGWAAVIAYRKKLGTDSGGEAGRLAKQNSEPMHTIDVLVKCDPDPNETAEDPLGWKTTTSSLPYVEEEAKVSQPKKKKAKGEPKDEKKKPTFKVRTLLLDSIEEISAVRIFMPEDTHPEQARNNVGKSVKEVCKRFPEPEGLPMLDPVNDMKIKSSEFEKSLEKVEKLTKELKQHAMSKLAPEERAVRLEAYEKKSTLIESGRLMRKQSKEAQQMVMKDELRRMKRVLKYMGHVDASGVIQLKGRTACEINTANELVATELTFGGIFAEFSVEQTVALLSCFTFDEKGRGDETNPGSGLRPVLAGPFNKLLDAARTVAKANMACKIECEEDEFLQQFNPGLMEAVYAWCKGAKFIDVQKLTDTYEGTTIRTLRRLEELVRQLASASSAVGNTEMREVFEKGSELIKRDIVFCNSLYL
ncbi:hypothetical protein TrST_g2438 [Triparma strigata]|uniref:ATP-dependent RNA helicase DOB1 n=1 Tax=Triparma strigata TaxID=1606541 RepID=A0A9W7DUW5_9STRA|nr:hypothetical protein TrST_g2438 [Triparma strigata]